MSQCHVGLMLPDQSIGKCFVHASFCCGKLKLKLELKQATERKNAQGGAYEKTKLALQSTGTA